jgi:hypothetical protein
LNWVVLLIRFTLFRIASTWSWLAEISCGLIAPRLAAWLVSVWTSSSRLDTSLSAPSAVFSTLFARWLLSTAWVIPAISLRSVSLAISPAGASLAELIFSPVLSRCRRVDKSPWFRCSRCVAWSDPMFVLIRLMRDPP